MPLKYQAYLLVGDDMRDLYNRKSSSIERLKKWARLKRIYKGKLYVIIDMKVEEIYKIYRGHLEFVSREECE